MPTKKEEEFYQESMIVLSRTADYVDHVQSIGAGSVSTDELLLASLSIQTASLKMQLEILKTLDRMEELGRGQK